MTSAAEDAPLDPPGDMHVSEDVMRAAARTTGEDLRAPVNGVRPQPSGGQDGSDAANPDRVVAFMDIGTNSIRLLLVRFNRNLSYSILSQQKEVVRLGEEEFVDRHLRPDAMRRAVLVCKTFTEMARAYGSEEIIAVATSATREARNQAEFQRMLRRGADLDIRTISGREEARLIYLGVSSGVHIESRPTVFIDIGGGSTELIVGDQAQHAFLDSLQLGTIRLTSMFFMPGETDPVPADRYALIRRYVQSAAVRSAKAIRERAPELAIGSSGTIENLADIAFRTIHGRARQPDDVLTRDDLRAVASRLCEASLEARTAIPGINPDRADIIVAGAAILETLMDEFGLTELRVSDRGLREGLIIDYLSRRHPAILEGQTVRERSVLQLGRRCHFEEAHARHVTELAMELFDSAAECGLHTLGDAEREILRHAAMLHDIGTFLTYQNHHVHSAYLIRNADLLGFDQLEVATIAAIARYHRKGFPRKKHQEIGAMPRSSRRAIRKASTLLRLAENLDRGRTGAVVGARLEHTGGQRVTLTIRSASDCQLELWGVRRSMRAFEKAFGLQLETRVVSAEPASSSERSAPGETIESGRERAERRER